MTNTIDLKCLAVMMSKDINLFLVGDLPVPLPGHGVEPIGDHIVVKLKLDQVPFTDQYPESIVVVVVTTVVPIDCLTVVNTGVGHREVCAPACAPVAHEYRATLAVSNVSPAIKALVVFTLVTGVCE